MSKVQEYLKKKRVQELGITKLYVVKSTRQGVEKPVEKEVIEIIENVAYIGEERLPIDRYKLKGAPYEVDIVRDKKSAKDDGYGSGVGDLWSWTYFYSFSKDEIEKYYKEEDLRIRNKYPKTTDMDKQSKDYTRVDMDGKPIINGSVIDINQTVNGQSLFVVLDIENLDIRYSYDLNRVYEYDMADLLGKEYDDLKPDINIVGNIYDYLNKL